MNAAMIFIHFYYLFTRIQTVLATNSIAPIFIFFLFIFFNSSIIGHQKILREKGRLCTIKLKNKTKNQKFKNIVQSLELICFKNHKYSSANSKTINIVI